MLTNEQKQRIDGLFKLWVDNDGAGGQLVVVHKGETVYEQCYCYEDAQTKEPITPDSLFLVASVSKQITAMSIMILHDRGILNIDDDIRKYLPDVVKFPETVTISHMLHHTSGIRECYELTALMDKPEGFVLTVPAVVELLSRQTKLNFEPGTRFSYCNSGYVLLAVIVERLTGMTLHEFAQENIFKPLGMECSCFPGCLSDGGPHRVAGHDDDGTSYSAVRAVSRTYGSGGLVTKCRDMVKFMPQYVNPTLVSKATMERYLTIPPLADGTVTNYACGVRINELLGHKYYHHGGVTGGLRAFTVIFPDDELVIAVFTNTYNIPIETAGRDIARIVLGLPEREKKGLDEYKTEGVDFDTIAGYYRNDTNGKCYDIKTEDGKAYVRFNSKWAPLYPLGGNLYKMGRRNITFAFGEKTVVNQEGSIAELRKMTAAPKQTACYVGTYYSQEARGTLTVAEEGGTLRLTTPNLRNEPLHLLEEDCFCFGSMTSNFKKLQFHKDENGHVTGLDYSAPQIASLCFEKLN